MAAFAFMFFFIISIAGCLSSDLDIDNWFSNSSRLQVSSRTKREAIAVNELADPILDDFRKKLLKKNENIVNVRDLTKSLSFKIFRKTVTYLTFKGYNSQIKDLSTIYRIGDVLLEKDDQGLTVSFRFGFWTLEYYCDSYLLKLTWFKLFGNLKVTVDDIEVFFEATAHKYNGECRYELKTLRIVKLDGIDVKLTGFSVLDKLMNLVVEKILDSFKETIKRTVEKELINSLTKAIEKTGVCTRV